MKNRDPAIPVPYLNPQTVLKETAFFPIPSGTLKQARVAAKNRGIEPDELMRAILVAGLNKLNGGPGKVEDLIPPRKIYLLEREVARMVREEEKRDKEYRAAVFKVRGRLSELVEAVETLPIN